MILVTTPTGNTGSLVLQQLVEAGQQTRVLVRNAAKLPTALRTDIEVVEGSMLDPDAFMRAAEDCDSMFFCIPQADDADDVDAHYKQFANAAVQAAKQGGVRRIVYLSGAGKDSPLAEKAGTITGLFHAEDVLTISGISLRVLRCPVFYESTLWQTQAIANAGTMFGLLPADYRHGQVAVRDIARAALSQLMDPTWNDVQSVGVFGPTDISMNEVAESISAAVDSPVRYQQIPRAAYVNNLRNFGVSDALATAVADMFEAIAAGVFDSEPRLADENALSFQQWVDEVFVHTFANAQQY